MADVRLVDLEVFKRFSLAVRREYAPAEAVLAVLEADRRAVLAAMDADDGNADGDLDDGWAEADEADAAASEGHA